MKDNVPRHLNINDSLPDSANVRSKVPTCVSVMSCAITPVAAHRCAVDRFRACPNIHLPRRPSAAHPARPKIRRVDRSKRMASLQRKLTSAEEKRHLEHVCLEIKLAVRSFLARADAQRIPTISFTANRRGRLVLRVIIFLIRLRSHVEEKRHRRRNCAQICDERVGEVRGRHGGDGQSKAFQRHLVKAEHALQKKITEPSILSFIDLSIYL